MPTRSSKRGPKRPNSTTPVRTCPTCGGAGQISDRRPELLYEELQVIARDAEVSPSQLSRMLSRNPKTKRGATLRTAMRVAKRMGLTLDELARIVHPTD